MSQIYEDQMKWKKLSNDKVEKLRASRAAIDEQSGPNSTIYSNNTSSNTRAHAREKVPSGSTNTNTNNNYSNNNNNNNQNTSSNIYSTNNKKSATDKSAAQQEVDMTPKVASNVPKYKLSDNSISNNNNYNKDGSAGENREKELYPPPQFDLKIEIDASAEEPLVELLERERRAWREERMALVNCIHMQQVELNQRSIAAHDRATEIAKELAKTIELFDSRLYAVENSSRSQADASNTIIKSLSDLTSKISQNLTSKSP